MTIETARPPVPTSSPNVDFTDDPIEWLLKMPSGVALLTGVAEPTPLRGRSAADPENDDRFADDNSAWLYEITYGGLT